VALRKPIMRELYQRLNAVPQGDDKGWIDPWLGKEKLLPGQGFDKLNLPDWDMEIEKVVEMVYGK